MGFEQRWEKRKQYAVLMTNPSILCFLLPLNTGPPDFTAHCTEGKMSKFVCGFINDCNTATQASPALHSVKLPCILWGEAVVKQGYSSSWLEECNLSTWLLGLSTWGYMDKAACSLNPHLQSRWNHCSQSVHWWNHSSQLFLWHIQLCQWRTPYDLNAAVANVSPGVGKTQDSRTVWDM